MPTLKQLEERIAALEERRPNNPGGFTQKDGISLRDYVDTRLDAVDKSTAQATATLDRRLAGLLLAGQQDRSVVSFQKGGIVCLQRDPETRAWALCWAVTPELVP